MKREPVSPSYCRCQVYGYSTDIGKECRACGMTIKEGTPTLAELGLQEDEGRHR